MNSRFSKRRINGLQSFCSAAPGAFQYYSPEHYLTQGRYLYEKENYRLARSYVDIVLKKIVDKDSLTYASAVDLGGLIDLDICHPSAALKAFEQAYTIRKSVLPSDDLFLAASQVNLGLALTEIGEFEKARGYLKQSIDIRIMHSSDRLGNSYSNMAILLLRMGKPDDAEAMLKSCPSLKDFSDETFFQTGNPRFSGSVLLVNPKSMIGTNVVQGYGAIEQNQVRSRAL
jgi:tetratricopeptide (TPR) repeat protein